MPSFLPQLPVDIQSPTPPAQTVYGLVNSMRQRGQNDHAASLESLQQQVDSLTNYLFSLIGYVRNLTNQSIGTFAVVQPPNSYTLTNAYADVPAVTLTLPVPGTWLVIAIADTRPIGAYVIGVRIAADGVATPYEQLMGSPDNPTLFPLQTFGFYEATTPNTVITLQARYFTNGVGSFIAGTTTPGNTVMGAICVQQTVHQ